MVKGHSDAMSGNPVTNAWAGGLAGTLQVFFLLPLNTVQTQMQTKGHTFVAAIQVLFRSGVSSGVRNLYRSMAPAIGTMGINRAIVFGLGASIKQGIPTSVPEPIRDATAGATAAVIKTCTLHPLDVLKTRWQMQMKHPRVAELYFGLLPAATRSSVGMAIWVSTRNALERSVPDIRGKHFICGALSGVFADLATFPLDTIKKRMQVQEAGKQATQCSSMYRGMVQELGALHADGGFTRFYRGYSARLSIQMLNGAIFNSVFVSCKNALENGTLRLPHS